jgi:site-specific recombinase XerD
VAGNKGKTFPPEPLTKGQVHALLRACSRRAPTGIRNAALIITLWRAGLRISEALALRPADLDAARWQIRVLHGKGDKARTVAIGPDAWAFLERWRDRRRELKIPRGAPLFCTLRGNSVHASYVRQSLPRLARKAGIERRVHPHALRHAYAMELSEEGLPLNLIQAALGHSHLNTTAIYLAHLAPKQVLDALRSRPEPELGR